MDLDDEDIRSRRDVWDADNLVRAVDECVDGSVLMLVSVQEQDGLLSRLYLMIMDGVNTAPQTRRVDATSSPAALAPTYSTPAQLLLPTLTKITQ